MQKHPFIIFDCECDRQQGEAEEPLHYHHYEKSKNQEKRSEHDEVKQILGGLSL